MIPHRFIAIFAASFGLLACSTPQPPRPAIEPALTAVPAPEIQRDLPLEQPGPGVGRVCKLGESCVSMDSRPFEACLVDTKHCVDKAVETLPARTPRDSEPEGPVKVSR